MTTNLPRRRNRAGQLPWRKDSVILARLPEVERMHLAGKPNTAIALKVGFSEAVIRADIKRIQELWLERVSGEVVALRAEAVAASDDVRYRAIAAAEFDEACERAVLFRIPFTDEHGEEHTVITDDKGAAKFTGSKAASLAVANTAIMNRAKIQGIVVDKQEHSADATFLDALRSFGPSGEGRSDSSSE